MCARYEISIDINELNQIVAQVNHNVFTLVKTGEIRPTNLAPILVEENESLIPTAAKWGFPRFDKKGVIINARAETVDEKKTFRKSMMERRCIVPASGFYEWDENKQKWLFKLEDSPLIYMAGLYNDYDGERRYTIITTAPNESIADIHDRMPLVLKQEQINDWVMNTDAAINLLKFIPPMLKRKAV